MRIARVETFLVPPRWLFCRIETDDGIVGWGEPVVEGRAEAVRATVEVFTEYLVGTDPLRITDTWQVLSRGGFYRDGPVLSSAVAGIDQALWDIAGKSYGARCTHCSAVRCATGCGCTRGLAATSVEPSELASRSRRRSRPASPR